jgi:NTP pyrophosphatase (non-canonical NTP hydrolase)
MTHSELVKTLLKNPKDILHTLTPRRVDKLHNALGIAGEAGEVVDVIKKHVMYNKPLDIPKIIEELGDLEFYLEGLRQNIGISRDETLAANIDKLGKRYSTLSYSDEQAISRADKA